MRIARLAWKLMWGARGRSIALLVVWTLSLSLLLAVEIGVREFQLNFRDEQGKWLGADLVMLTREPLEEFTAQPLILETIATVGGHALHVKVSDLPSSGARLSDDAAQLLHIKRGDSFALGTITVTYSDRIGEEPDRFIGLPSALPRLHIRPEVWEASALGTTAAPPLYRYLFPHPAAGTKQALLEKYPGALVIGKADRYDDAEATVAQALTFARVAGVLGFLLGVVCMYSLLRLAAQEDVLDAARLKLAGASTRTLTRISIWKTLWCCLLGLPLAWPLSYAILWTARWRIGYFLPYERIMSDFPWPAFTLMLAAMLGFVLLAVWPQRRVAGSRPGPLLREELNSPNRRQQKIMLLAVATAVSGSGLTMAYLGLSPALSLAALPDEDGLVIIGDGPAAGQEFKTVWARILDAPSERTMALATCSPARAGLWLEESFAKRIGAKADDSLQVAVGRQKRALKVDRIQARSGLKSFLSQIEIPCDLANAAPSFRISWMAGRAEELRSKLPPETISISASEWRGRVEDLAARAIFLPQLCVVYGSALALLIATISWRRLLWQRREEIALWRSLGASKKKVASRILSAWLWKLIAAIAAGAIIGWGLANTLLSYLAGRAIVLPISWVVMTILGLAPLIFFLWRVELNRQLALRPLDILRSR